MILRNEAENQFVQNTNMHKAYAIILGKCMEVLNNKL